MNNSSNASIQPNFLTYHDLRLIMLALTMTSNIPSGGSAHIEQQNAEMRELYHRLEEMLENADFGRPMLYNMRQGTS